MRGRTRAVATTVAMAAVIAGAGLRGAALAAPAGAVSAAPEIEHVRVPSHDGVELDGWLLRPAGVPASAKLPIVLWSGPYFGQSEPTGDDPAQHDNSTEGEA